MKRNIISRLDILAVRFTMIPPQKPQASYIIPPYYEENRFFALLGHHQLPTLKCFHRKLDQGVYPKMYTGYHKK